MKQISYFLRSIYRKLPGIAIRFISKPNPVLIEGFNARNKVGNICKENGYSKCLLITDETLFSLGFHIEIVNSLKENNIDYVIYNEINCEPNIKTIFSARQIAIDSNIDCVIALGGGSVLDNAKMIAVGLKYKNLSIENLLLKILFVGKMVPIINIPSTAGTGAEISVGAVVKDNKGVKRATCISGLNVSHIILDSQLTINTPSKVTSYCGIDALSHCIEGIVADINVDSHIRETSYEGVNIVFNALPILIDDPNNLEKRQAMQRAAYYGGLAISYELAGYVHAFAHTIGAKYKISHGEAIAICLLPVLRKQENVCNEQYKKIMEYCKINDDLLIYLSKFYKECDIELRKLNIDVNDYDELYRGVVSDSLNYSAPVTFSKNDIYEILREL